MKLGDPCPTEGCTRLLRTAERLVEDENLYVRGLGTAKLDRKALSEWTYKCSWGHKHADTLRDVGA
jgi:hypothetical protein